MGEYRRNFFISNFQKLNIFLPNYLWIPRLRGRRRSEFFYKLPFSWFSFTNKISNGFESSLKQLNVLTFNAVLTIVFVPKVPFLVLFFSRNVSLEVIIFPGIRLQKKIIIKNQLNLDVKIEETIKARSRKETEIARSHLHLRDHTKVENFNNCQFIFHTHKLKKFHTNFPTFFSSIRNASHLSNWWLYTGTLQWEVELIESLGTSLSRVKTKWFAVKFKSQLQTRNLFCFISNSASNWYL